MEISDKFTIKENLRDLNIAATITYLWENDFNVHITEGYKIIRLNSNSSEIKLPLFQRISYIPEMPGLANPDNKDIGRAIEVFFNTTSSSIRRSKSHSIKRLEVKLIAPITVSSSIDCEMKVIDTSSIKDLNELVADFIYSKEKLFEALDFQKQQK
ncbi:MAG: hypothetical protein KKA65_05560 [Nanoarchaeota archaeon]|nr:hypothetical protein [Nanoarchaeota archaeon]MBU4241857.1 hypothetical protein [Nanoarchaeota archaeon]MBU4351827.1 hypothetical protein [Nanoarchaeota archaeon]MBU4456937.1 hypothetical protein [Nanoarchaeota archaeon]